MAEENAQKPEPLPIERAADFVSVYANNVHVKSSAWDITLEFGQFQGSSKVQQRAAVTMAWAEAKAVAEILLSNIAFYESYNGRIRMPKGMTPQPIQRDETNPTYKALDERINQIRELIFGEE